MYSFPVAIPLNGNRHILKNIDDKDSELRPIFFEHQQARINVDGMPFRSGQMQIQEDEELEDNISMNVTASDKSLDTLIGDLSCRDIPVKDKIIIGEKIGNIGVSVQYLYSIHVNYKKSRKKDSRRNLSQYSKPAAESPNGNAAQMPVIPSLRVKPMKYPNGRFITKYARNA